MRALHASYRQPGQIELPTDESQERLPLSHRSGSPKWTSTVAIRSNTRATVATGRDPLLITTVIRDRYGIRERPVRRSSEQPGGTTVSRFPARVVVIGAFVAYVLLVAELGGHLTGHSHAIAAQPPPESSAQPHVAGELRMGPVFTGIPIVDDGLRGFLSGDAEGAFSQLIVQQVACGTLPSGGAPFLPCLATEPRGTVHEVILSTCEPKWVTAEAAKAELATALADAPGVYAIDGLNGSYTAVLSWPGALDRSLVLTISAAGITSYGTACGPPLDQNPGRELEFATAPGADKDAWLPPWPA